MKKRIWVLWTVLLLMLLAGCTPTPEVQPVTTDFTCRAVMTYREMTLETQLTRHTDGGLDVAFSLPKSLSGITLGWDGTDMTMELGGVRMSLPAEKVPEGALIRCLLQVLSSQPGTATKSDDGVVFTGQVEGKDYELVCHPVTGLPLSLSVPEEGLTAVFSDAEIITKQE